MESPGRQPAEGTKFKPENWAPPSTQDSATKFWLGFATLTVSLIVIASFLWMQDHPFGISWDEAEYFDRVLSDLQRFKTGGLLEWVKGILTEDTIRPPAYRLFAFPFVLFFGFSPLNVRLVSMAFFVASLVLVYLSVRCMVDSAAGAFTVVFLALCPIMIFSGMVFGTEYPLFFATAAMLYFLFAAWNQRPESRRNWIGLGLALGLGALAKTSFVLLAGPVLAIAVFLAWRKLVQGPSIQFLAKAILLGGLVALPWWVRNFRSALWYAWYGSTSRHSLGVPSLENWAKWLGTWIESILGPALAIILACIFLVWVLSSVSKFRNGLTRPQVAVLWICLLSPLPLVLNPPLFGTNYNPRYVTPALIVGVVGVGVLVKLFNEYSRVFDIGTSISMGVQLALTIYPAFVPVVFPTNLDLFEKPPWLVMARVEQWDWEPLWKLAHSYEIEQPDIAFLGSAREFNWPSIAYPWLLHNEGFKDVKWLWRPEQGTIDWDKIMAYVAGCDLVLTVPSYTHQVKSLEDADNQHNYEFAKRLENAPEFKRPIYLTMGRFEPVEVAVFVNKSAVISDNH